MLDELIRSLGPNPILQVLLGTLAFGAGVYAIIQGIRSSNRESGTKLEDKKAEWAAYQQLQNIEQNTFRLIDLQGQTVTAIKHLTDAIHNRRQF